MENYNMKRKNILFLFLFLETTYANQTSFDNCQKIINDLKKENIELIKKIELYQNDLKEENVETTEENIIEIEKKIEEFEKQSEIKVN
jgi:hypothetical protein